ncbi:hypothetical protein [Paenibacillus silvae]|uniref:Uncharacterized protein n=1 Tax=Paenibacillus silvae TaxID=1325358 RepID=A0A2W6NDY1_9BACL|nr:hypothetical protein [Paenibacillus silvae]PZT54142.1 hypothetical protein DN757_19115 [Paenibacillus silvae]
MPNVKILVDAVGGYSAGDIVKDAPAGLVDIALKETRNAATGQLLAEIMDDSSNPPSGPTEREVQLEAEVQRLKAIEAELLEKIDLLQSDDELKELKAVAKEMKIPGYTKMDTDELKKAIASVGGDNDGK